QEQLAMTHDNLGQLLVNAGEREAARAEFEKARDLLKRLADEHPGVPAHQIALARTYGNLGETARAEGRPSEGLAWYEKAIVTLAPFHRAEPGEGGVKAILRNIHAGRAT